mmetsp:Transcript_46398/g.108026  ORF Transcript_46398/g.108026 Transcript_46398/m.108026 type:complete len:242 (+) Transcript_46398:1815-2540(+)
MYIGDNVLLLCCQGREDAAHCDHSRFGNKLCVRRTSCGALWLRWSCDRLRHCIRYRVRLPGAEAATARAVALSSRAAKIARRYCAISGLCRASAACCVCQDHDVEPHHSCSELAGHSGSSCSSDLHDSALPLSGCFGQPIWLGSTSIPATAAREGSRRTEDAREAAIVSEGIELAHGFSDLNLCGWEYHSCADLHFCQWHLRSGSHGCGGAITCINIHRAILHALSAVPHFGRCSVCSPAT